MIAKMQLSAWTLPANIDDRSRNVKYEGWLVMIQVSGETVFERKYHSTKCTWSQYHGYDGKAFNEKDAIKQTQKEFAAKLRELLK